jgi:N6-adenosine-specific RNA methylase IME4
MIAGWFQEYPKVELFARQTTPGWAVWGNEVAPTVEIAADSYTTKREER